MELNGFIKLVTPTKLKYFKNKSISINSHKISWVKKALKKGLFYKFKSIWWGDIFFNNKIIIKEIYCGQKD